MDAETPKPTENETRLFQAAVEGSADKTRELLSAGTNVNVKSAETFPLGCEWNTTPLVCAAANGHSDIVRILLDAGADVSARTEAHKTDGGGGSQALHHALARNQIHIARLLLDAGANPNALGNAGCTPLTCALLPMSLSGVRLLLERGAHPNPEVKRKDYRPPLYTAALVISNTTSMVSRNGMIVLEVAEIWERKDEVIEIFRWLIKAGADPNAAGPQHSTALGRLVMCGRMPDELRLPLVEMLIAAGASPDQADKDGHTPLSLAVRFPHPRVIELLHRSTQRQSSEPVNPEPVSKSNATEPAADPSAGAADFLQFISEGDAEWALLVIKAPIQQTIKEFTLLLKPTSVRPNVPIKPAGEDDEIDSAIAVVSVDSNPWTVVYLSLFYANEKIINQAIEAAKSLSSQLSTHAIVYAAESTSDEPGILQFKKGEAVGHELQMVDEDEANRSFQDLGVYLPACYPRSEAGSHWLAVENASANRIDRADLILT